MKFRTEKSEMPMAVVAEIHGAGSLEDARRVFAEAIPTNTDVEFWHYDGASGKYWMVVGKVPTSECLVIEI